ncbi:E+ motif [Dillenia turbinata]|uniref:E+ motif n=1 Tax=Dillenia turbinata TaxID=194707 RepID=A0AAN8UPD6_9MAGN
MREVAVKKETGCSLVTMTDGSQVFIAGDKSHPNTDLIYEKLRELQRKMRDPRYKPQALENYMATPHQGKLLDLCIFLRFNACRGCLLDAGHVFDKGSSSDLDD